MSFLTCDMSIVEKQLDRQSREGSPDHMPMEPVQRKEKQQMPKKRETAEERSAKLITEVETARARVYDPTCKVSEQIEVVKEGANIEEDQSAFQMDNDYLCW